MADGSDEAKPARVPLVDPEAIPVRVANRIVGLGYVGSLFDLTLATSEGGADLDGTLHEQAIIAARLRFDLDFARRLHTQLGNAIAAVTTPPRDQVN